MELEKGKLELEKGKLELELELGKGKLELEKLRKENESLRQETNCSKKNKLKRSVKQRILATSKVESLSRFVFTVLYTLSRAHMSYSRLT